MWKATCPAACGRCWWSLLKVLNDAEGIDLTPLKKAVEEA